jgi:type II secretory pathway predicted ATPase ExeA
MITQQPTINQEKDYKFLMTESIETVIQQINSTVTRDEWIALFGDYGMGKTEIKEYLISEWTRKRDYIIIQFPSFESKVSRITHIMTWMLRQINPGDHVPSNIELKAEKLRTALMKARTMKRKVVLICEDVGSIHPSTFRELKKVHELTGLSERHLFSILMFGNMTRSTETVLESPEVGLRCKLIQMEYLSQNEMMEFATRRFGLKFPKGNEGKLVIEQFSHRVGHTPLAIKYFAEKLSSLKDFSGEVTISSMIKAKYYEMKYLKEKIRKLDISYSDIQVELKRMGGKSSVDTIKGVLNDNGSYKESTIQDIVRAAENLASKKEENELKVANS